MTDAFYRCDGDEFVATVHTTGPWDPRMQHGGPPTALIVRAFESMAVALNQPHLARVTVELIRPVPVGRLQVKTEMVKAGRSVSRVAARLIAEGREVLHATGLVMRSRPLDIEASAALDVPDAETAAPISFPFFRTEVGYHTAVEMRIARGTFGQTPTFAWIRTRVGLVDGETLSPAQRVAIAADSGNGVSSIVDWRKYSFINPDLTIAWNRPLDGDWVGLDATMQVLPKHGVGLARTVICDAHGPVGAGLQSLLYDPVVVPGPDSSLESGGGDR